MTSPNSTFTELVSTTIRNRRKEFADNVTNNNALLSRLESKGNIKPTFGGTSIMEEVEWAENSTSGFYSGYELLDTSASDVLSSAEFDWKQASTQVVASGLETRVINKGKEKMIDLLDSRIKNAMHSMKNTISTSVYSDGTGSSGKEIGGLQLLVAEDPTASSSVGGINQNTYTFWRNQFDNTTLSAANVEATMNSMWLNTVRGSDKVDLIVADQAAYNFYEGNLQQYQRFNDSDMAAKGFTSLKYKTADVIYDDMSSSTASANRMWFLNTDYICLRVDPDSNYEPLPDRASTNQDSFVLPVVWAGNMTVCNRSLQGIIFA